MSAPISPLRTGNAKFDRNTNIILASIYAGLLKDSQKYGGIAKSKLREALLSVKKFQKIMVEGRSMTGDHDIGMTQIFVTVRQSTRLLPAIIRQIFF